MELNIAKYKRNLKRLFALHVCQCILMFLAFVPYLATVLKWINILILLGMAFVLFDLSKEMNCKRFFKAAIFILIVDVLNVIIQLGDNTVITLARSIFLILSLYQECNGHSEILTEVNGTLSKRWKDYFGIYLWTTISANMLLSAFIIALRDVFFQYAVLTILIISIASAGYAVVLDILYLINIKHTLKI